MKKEKVKNILLNFALFIAGLFVIYLYLPTENQDLTLPYSYLENSRGVNFGGKIQNSPTKTGESQFLEIAPPQICSTSYATAGSFSQGKTESRLIANSTVSSCDVGAFNSSSNSLSQSNPNHGASSGGGYANLQSVSKQQTSMEMAGSHPYGSSAVSSAGKNTSMANNPQAHGFSSFSNDLALNATTQFDDKVGRQRSNNDLEDPPPSYAPVGDGFWLLLLYVGFYLVWKKRFVSQFKLFIQYQLHQT